jgi:crotonobetainyl-CoA:carnitine CoA-transferase CaiB-like acyl-CoA transferase
MVGMAGLAGGFTGSALARQFSDRRRKALHMDEVKLHPPQDAASSLMPNDALRALWRSAGGPPEALDAVTLSGAEPALPSSFAIGTAAQASLAASALASAEIGRLRGGSCQRVAVEMRHAAIEFRSERYLRIDGELPPDPWDRIAGLYRCGDGGWVRLHTNFPHHRDGVLALLCCAHEREAVQRALGAWSALEFEEVAARAGLVVAALRSFDEWDAHAQGQADAALAPLTIERIEPASEAGAPPLPLGAIAPDAPVLAGLRVLDLTRIIAGPVAGRALAAQGAEVLMITAAHLPSIETTVIDTGRGKRSAHIDLRRAEGREALSALARDADVFIQGYRPGAVAGFGFDPTALAAQRPGIVVGSVSAYGHTGPWATRRGFDSLVQTACGFNLAEAVAAGQPDAPRALPAQALDHATGYLLALGVQLALRRRSTEGGSWHVRVALSRTARWLRSLGRVPQGFAAADPRFGDVTDLLDTVDSGFGRLTGVRHAARLSLTPPRWVLPAVPLGTHEARWLPSGEEV